MIKVNPIIRSMALFYALLVLLFLNNTVIASEQGQLNDFLGEWQSSDDAFGQAAISRLHWQEVLAGKFVRLDYTISATQNAAQNPMFSGVAYYRETPNGELEAFWADSGGDLLPIEASRVDRLLIANWGVAGGKQGKTHYQLNDDGGLLVTDWIKKDDQWQQFNKGKYARVETAR